MGLLSNIFTGIKNVGKYGDTPKKKSGRLSKYSHIQEAQSSLAPPTRRGGFAGGLVSYTDISKVK